MNKSRLGDCCEFILDGTHGSPVRTESGIPVLSAQNVVGGKLSFETNRFTSLKEYEAFRRRLDVSPSDVLLTIVGTIGRVAIVTEKKPLVLQRSVAVLRPKQHLLLPKFLYYALQRDSVKAQLASSTNQSSQAGIYLGKLKEVEIPLPPLDEQRRIAAVLDKADALREKRRQAIKKLDALLQSVFLDMFGDPVTNPKGWKLGVLGDVIHSAKDGPHVSPQYSDEGIPFLSTRHIRHGRILWEDLKFITREHAEIHWKKCKPEGGDVLYTKGGTTGIAKAIDFDREIAIWVHIALLKTNHDIVDPKWLEQMLNSSYCYAQSQEYTHGIANHDLGLTRMVKIKMYIPPLRLQKRFSEYAAKLQCLEGKQEDSLSKLNNLFHSLQQRAFKSELFDGMATAAALPRKLTTTSQPELFD
jgi:type I restriction enzyme S subunit